jgi:hypothetical protein
MRLIYLTIPHRHGWVNDDPDCTNQESTSQGSTQCDLQRMIHRAEALAMTYQRQVLLSHAVLSLNIDEDDDGNAATHGKAAPEKQNLHKVPMSREWLNKDTEQFLKVIAYLNGGGNISEVEKKYKLSKQIKETLTKP